jgi:hypothetical protein
VLLSGDAVFVRPPPLDFWAPLQPHTVANAAVTASHRMRRSF